MVLASFPLVSGASPPDAHDGVVRQARKEESLPWLKQAGVHRVRCCAEFSPRVGAVTLEDGD
jgi:hypothetical protein